MYLLVVDKQGKIHPIVGDTKIKVLLLVERGINTPPEICKHIYGYYNRQVVQNIYHIIRDLEKKGLIKRVRTKEGTVLVKQYRVIYPLDLSYVLYTQAFLTLVVAIILYVMQTPLLPYLIIILYMIGSITSLLMFYTYYKRMFIQQLLVNSYKNLKL